jgi:SOS-response transcriptional repressor LexA
MAATSVILPELSTAILPDAANIISGHSTGMNLKEVLKRVDARLKATGQSQDGASKAAEKPDAIRNMRRALASGRSGVSTKTIAALAPVLGVQVSWLLTGEGEEAINQLSKKAVAIPKSVTGIEIQPYAEGFDDPAIVPEIDLDAGASYAGGFNQEEKTIDQHGNFVSRDAIRANWGIPIPFLRNELHIRPERAHILPVRGDSMNDALFDGDRAIINLDDTDLSQGGIFALIDDNSSILIKQVEIVRTPGPKRIKCTSRNPVYEPFEIVLTENVKIIGRVASKITRL